MGVRAVTLTVGRCGVGPKSLRPASASAARDGGADPELRVLAPPRRRPDRRDDPSAGTIRGLRRGSDEEDDVVGQPVGLGGDQGADAAAQAGDLGPHGDEVLGVAVERGAQGGGGEAVRVAGQQHQDLGVAPGERGAPGAAAGVDLEHRPPGGVVDEPGRHRGGAAARSHEPAAGQPLGHARAQARHGQGAVGHRHLDPVAGGDAGVVGHPAVVVDHQQRPGETADHRLDGAAQVLQPLLVVAPQLGLGEAHRAVDQGAERGVEGQRGPGHVDDAEQLAGAGVVHGRGRAVPRVLLVLEVLGREQLHRRGLGQGGADRVGADDLLGPGGALGEAEPVGVQLHPGGALAPQDDPVGVADDHEELRGVGDAGEHPTDLVDHQRQARRTSTQLQVGRRQRVARVVAVGVEPQAHHPRPRAGNQGAGSLRRARPAQHGVVDAGQRAGLLGQVGSRRLRVHHAPPPTRSAPSPRS